MRGRLGNINFNLMRAIEMFADLNHMDMDVDAPPSSDDYHKESAFAHRLNGYMGQMIEEGFFDDCDLREEHDPDDDDDDEAEEEDGEENDSQPEDRSSSIPFSEGFEYPYERSSSQQGRTSPLSLTGRLGNYVRRIMPGRSSQNRHHSQHEPTEEEEEMELEQEEDMPRDGARSPPSMSRSSASSSSSRQKTSANRLSRSGQMRSRRS